MPFTGNTFTRLRSWIADASVGLKIRSDLMDQDTNDIAGGLTAVMTAVTTLTQSLAAGGGAALISFIATGSSFLRTVAAVLNDTPNVKNWGAKGDGVTDDTAAFNAAAAYVKAVGGDVLFIPRGQFNLDSGGYVYDGVSLRGTGKLTTTLFKGTATTQAVTVTAGSLVVYNNNPLPPNINAVLVLDGPGGRYRGSIKDLRILGGLTVAGQPETALVEFGIVQLGTESDFILEDCQIENVQYSVMLPDVFAAEISNNRFEACLRGPAIDSGTSLEYHSNYSNNCRDWGRYFRNISYTKSSGNAIDSLNNPTMYPTRTRTCVANKLRSLTGFTSISDGCEQPYGIVWELDTLDNCSITYPTVYGFGSDYSGVDEMAVVSIKGAWRDCEFKNLRGVGLKASGLLSGGAIPLAAHHHDVYVDPATVVIGSAVTGVLLTTTLGSRVPAGFGNNVPNNTVAAMASGITWPNLNVSNGQIYSNNVAMKLSAVTPGDIAWAPAADNAHFVQEIGNIRRIWGVFHGALTYTTASGFLIATGMPTNGSKVSAVAISGQTLPASFATRFSIFEMGAANNAGIFYNAAGATQSIASIPTGTTVRIYYDGMYSVA